jgi:hypothetical protein
VRQQSDKIVYNVVQLYISVVCLGIGIVLTLPGDSFGTSKSYTLLRGYPITENQWGIIYSSLGIACAIGTYFSKQIAEREGNAEFGGKILTAIYRMLRITWFLVTPLMFFWAWSFIISNTATVGTVFFLSTSGLSMWVFLRVKKEARQHDTKASSE